MQLNLSIPSIGAVLIASIAGFASPASAIQINFDDQGLLGPDNFNEAGDAQTLDIATGIGNVRFEGGVIISAATNLFNETSVYGTGNNIDNFIADASIDDNFTRQNPLIIEFENPIENFFIDVFNGLPEPGLEYTVADDIGNSSTFALDSVQAGGFQTIGFPATGTVVTIAADISDTNGAYDFFIDNINFNAALPDDILEAVEEVVVPTPPSTPIPTPIANPSEPSDPVSVPEPFSIVSLLVAGALAVSQKIRQTAS